jgi:hypothetical protein
MSAHPERCSREGITKFKHHPSHGWDESADPRKLDRAADAELAHGHYERAEYLAARADALRAVSP